MNRRITTALASVAVLAFGLAGCGSSGADTTTQAGQQNTSTARADSAKDLSGVCPKTVVMQQDWQPEAEHSAMYQLVGAGYQIDVGKKRVTGPLVSGGQDTGVDVEVRAGGPSVGFQPVPALMYLDKSILVGAVSSDGAIAGSVKQPTTAVVAPLNKSPQILMWDPKTYPQAKTIADVTKTGAVVVTAGDIIPKLLMSKGLIKKPQIDTGYEGTPARFVGDPKILQQGFISAEPYIYEHEVSAWKQPIGSQLLADIGYDIYPEALSVRTEDVTKQAACLKKLVPILQQAQLDYLKNPEPVNKLIVELVRKYNTGWTYSEGVATYAAESMKKYEIIANDPATGSLGGFDEKRVQEIIDTFEPILKQGGAEIKSGLTPADLATNEFVDKSIKQS
ncbi:substrate-binding domain-containing protein [Flindersiella endophytica]